MKNRKILFLSSLIILVIAFSLLVSGASLLEKSLTENSSIPFGTFITWFGIISLQTSIYFGCNQFRKPSKTAYKYLSNLLKGLIILAILWLPICYFLAGNFSFTFTEKETFQGGQLAMKWFWRFSIGIVLGAIILLLFYWISLFLKKRELKV